MTHQPASPPHVTPLHEDHTPRCPETSNPVSGAAGTHTRRALLLQLSGVTAVTYATGGLPGALATTPSPPAQATDMGPAALQQRQWQAYRRRRDAAIAHSMLPLPSFPTNGDETAYPTPMACFTKGCHTLTLARATPQPTRRSSRPWRPARPRPSKLFRWVDGHPWRTLRRPMRLN